MSTIHAYRRPYDARIRRGLPVRLISASPTVTYIAIGGIFLYTDANWNDDLSFFLEASFRATTGSANVRLFDLTDASAVVSSNITSTSSTLNRVRSAALTLVNGNEYQVQVGTTSGSIGAITGAKLVAT